MRLIFQENYENSNGEMEGSAKHVSRNVQKFVQGDDKENEYNCIEGEAISTTTCIRGMQSLIYSLCTSNLILAWNINFQLFCCRNEKRKMELIQHIGQDDKEKKSWLQSLWVLMFLSSLINISYLLSSVYLGN